MFKNNKKDIDINTKDLLGADKKTGSSVYERIKIQKAKREKKHKMIRFSVIGTLILVILVISVVKLSIKSSADNGDVDNSSQNQTDAVAVQGSPETQSTKAKIKVVYPTVSSSYADVAPSLAKASYIAMLDVENNSIIAGRDYQKVIYPASMTKVMTLIVAVENLKSMDQKFTFTFEIISPLVKQQASRAGFDPGEEVDAMNLLYGLVLPSGADSAVALANMVAGSEQQFVTLMNQKCEEMGLKNTHFTNTSGLHDPNNYTTPTEMAMIMEYAMKNEICAKLLSTYQYTTTPTPQHPQGILLTSTMFSRMYGTEVPGMTITAGKTGYTDEAGNCLVSYAEKNGRHFVVVLAGGSYKWDSIYDDFHVFQNYTP